jgi:alpha-L-fucosidase
MFSDAGPDVRWIGNERGVAGETNWSTVDPAVVPYPGATGGGVMRMLQQGDPNGTVWRPGETDVSIRRGWFYHPAEDGRVRSVENLVGLYFTSVGRNSKLLLNVPPTPEGLIHEIDAQRLIGMRQRLDAIFRTNALGSRPVPWRPIGPRAAQAAVTFETPVTVSVTDVREPIERGQVVARYLVQGLTRGGWQPVARGTTIGYRKLDRFDPVEVSAIRVTIEDALDTPPVVAVAAY